MDGGFPGLMGGMGDFLFGSNPMPNVGGASPYQGNWDSLIKMLQARASGQGPSLAADAFKQASTQGMQNAQAMSRGGSPGGAYAAQNAISQTGQGQAQGMAHARNEEMLGSQNALAGALGGAGQSWLAPQAMSLQAWGLQNQYDASKLSALSQLLGAGGQLFGGGSKGGGGGGA